MQISDWNKIATKENPHGVDVRLMYDMPDAQAVIISLEPGKSLKPHITPVDVFFFVAEGNPTFLVGEEKQSAGKFSLVASPKNIVHCIYNETDEIVRVLVVKTPKPELLTKVL